MEQQVLETNTENIKIDLFDQIARHSDAKIKVYQL